MAALLIVLAALISTGLLYGHAAPFIYGLRGAHAQTYNQTPVPIASPYNITQPGEYVLAANLTGVQSSGYLLGIFASNVVLNGEGHSISYGYTGYGIYVAPGASNVLIENVTVMGYSTDIFIGGSSDRLVNVSTLYNFVSGITLSGYNDSVAYSSSYYGSTGIYVNGSGDVISHVKVVGSGVGVYIAGSGNTVKGSLLLNNVEYGLQVYGSDNRITGSVLSGNLYGAYVDGSYNTLEGSEFENSTFYGLYINGSHNTVSYNTIADNGGFGAEIYGPDNTLQGNTFVNDGLFTFYLNTVENNTVNGKPLVYLYGVSGETISNAGQVIVIDSSNVRISGLNVYNSSIGIELLNTNSSTIENTIISDENYYGIYINGSGNTAYNDTFVNNSVGVYFTEQSSHNVLKGSRVVNSTNYGIVVLGRNNEVDDSYVASTRVYDGVLVNGTDNLVAGSTLTGNGYFGVEVYGSGNTVNGSYMINNFAGISLDGTYNTAANLTISGSRYAGVYINYYSYYNTVEGSHIYNNQIGAYVLSNGNVLKGNTFVNDGLFTFYLNTVENNTVNGKPLVYLYGVSGETISNAGQVIVIDSSNVRISGLNVYNSSIGIELLNTNSSTIENTIISDENYYGIYINGTGDYLSAVNVTDSDFGIYINGSYNTVSGSYISHTRWEGIDIEGSYNTIVGTTVTYGGLFANGGIVIDGSYNRLINSTVTNSISPLNAPYFGAVYISGSYNTVSGTAVVNNNGDGIDAYGSNTTIVSSYIAGNAGNGIFLGGSYDLVANSTISYNGNYGIFLAYSYDDMIYNNLFDNVNNVGLIDSFAYWNTTLRAGRNIVGGYMIGGNAWLSPYGNGFSQVTPPLPSDPYICDQPYVISGNNVDYLPLKYTTYTITFVESGLPAGTEWSVTLNGTTQTSSNSTIAFSEPNGNYVYTVESPVSGGEGTRYVAVSATGTITVNGAGVNVSVVYETQYYLTLIVTPEDAGNVSPASGWYYAGSSVNISATAKSGYEFYRWAGTGSGSYTGSGNPATVVMNSPITENATFLVGLNVSVSGITSGAQGTVVTINGVPYTYSQLPVTVYVLPGSNVTYSFAQQVYGGSGVRFVWVRSSGPSAAISGSFVMASEPSELRGVYQAQYYLTMIVTPSGAGNVSPSSGWYNAGTEVTISATPASGYEFLYWSGAGNGSYSGRNASAVLTLYSPITENATFVRLVQVTFTESGLPPGTQWSVTLDGVTKSTTNSTITFLVPPGSYTYTISTVSGYKVTQSSGTLAVSSTSPPAPVSVSYISTTATSSYQQTQLYLAAGAAVLVAAVAAALLIRRRK
ncbi:MAG: right-handed parallel beta-helix repeat-containing protein [Nitrososphaeria archaeon]